MSPKFTSKMNMGASIPNKPMLTLPLGVEEELEDGAFHCFMTGPMGVTDLKIKMPVE